MRTARFWAEEKVVLVDIDSGELRPREEELGSAAMAITCAQVSLRQSRVETSLWRSDLHPMLEFDAKQDSRDTIRPSGYMKGLEVD
jgi:hypothetical protein